MESPHVINFKEIGDSTGKLVVAGDELNFDIKRVFWIYDVEEGGQRGNHANIASKKIVVCLKGRVEVELEDLHGEKSYYTLSRKNEGLLIPVLYWNRIRFLDGAVLMCIASEEYNEADYIRNYEEFKNRGND